MNASRREFLKTGLMALAVCALPRPALALTARVAGSKNIAFHNLHTDERMNVCFWKDGHYDQAALARINHILRDFRSGDVFPMKANLMDLLHDLQMKLGNDNPIEIISGYRSPRTNAALARASGGVAGHSYHMQGMAIDIRMSGTSLAKLHNTAMSMRRGGVGYYPTSDFVHVDVGPLRRW